MASLRAPLEDWMSQKRCTCSLEASPLKNSLGPDFLLSLEHPVLAARTTAAAAVQIITFVSFIVSSSFVLNRVVRYVRAIFLEHAAVHQPDDGRPGEHNEGRGENEQDQGEAHLDRRLGRHFFGGVLARLAERV